MPGWRLDALVSQLVLKKQAQSGHMVIQAQPWACVMPQPLSSTRPPAMTQPWPCGGLGSRKPQQLGKVGTWNTWQCPVRRRVQTRRTSYPARGHRRLVPPLESRSEAAARPPVLPKEVCGAIRPG